jgi:hypothetical protein
MGVIFKFFQGRHTFFGLFFAITAFILAMCQRLTHDYIEVIIALQAYVLIHSAKEDRNERAKVEVPKL